MSIVTFPGLGLVFELDRVAFSIAGRPIYWYGVIIAVGVLLAIFYCHAKAPQYGIIPDNFLDMLFIAIPAAIIGARLYYVLFNLGSFRGADGRLNFLQMLKIWDGGVAIYGGVLAGLLAGYIFCKIRKFKFRTFADLAVCGLLIGQMIGRWGNFVNIEVYGRDTTLPWRMGVYEWTNGIWMSREVHPTFLYESLWNLMGFLLIAFIAKRWRKFDGQNLYSYLVWYGVGRAVIEGIRDPSQNLYFWGTPFYVSQIVGVVSALIGGALLIYHFIQNKKEDIPNDNHGWEGTGTENEGGDSL